MTLSRTPRRFIQRPATQLTAALFALMAFAATGCNNSKTSPTPENFTTALNAHFLEHPDCLLANTRFPYETTDKTTTKQMDSLVKAELLTKQQDTTSIHASRYTVAPAGTRYAPRFCYGHRIVASIDTATPLGVVNGFHQSSVTYHYTMEDVPVWAKTPEVLAAFPQMAHAISDQSVGKATLAQTISGWEVPD